MRGWYGEGVELGDNTPLQEAVAAAFLSAFKGNR